MNATSCFKIITIWINWNYVTHGLKTCSYDHRLYNRHDDLWSLSVLHQWKKKATYSMLTPVLHCGFRRHEMLRKGRNAWNKNENIPGYVSLDFQDFFCVSAKFKFYENPQESQQVHEAVCRLWTVLLTVREKFLTGTNLQEKSLAGFKPEITGTLPHNRSSYVLCASAVQQCCESIKHHDKTWPSLSHPGCAWERVREICAHQQLLSGICVIINHNPSFSLN